MRVARYYSQTDIRLEAMPRPEIGPGELLVQVEVCGICGSDTMAWYLEQRAPLVIGHEPVGTVAAAGEGVTEFAAGDRVFVHHHVPCFVCHYCRRGHYSMCRTFHATNVQPGGFAEYIRVPALNVARDVLKLPDSVSFEEATLIEPLACGIRGFRRLHFEVGDTVAVVGCGIAGLLQIQLARLLGAGLVVATDVLDYRLQAAERFGADLAWNPKTVDVAGRVREINAGRGADVVVVCAGSVPAMQQGLDLAGKGATVQFFAPTAPGVTLPIEPHRLFFEEMTIDAVYSASHLETRPALEYIRQGKINARDLITDRFGLAEAGLALRTMIEAKGSMKVLVEPQR